MPDTSFTTFTLGKYRAVELLGKGGFGTVYRAIDTTLDREVALKVLHPQLVADPTFVERFRTEAKIIAALRHPNVVGVYELGEEAGRLFIAMEYMPGGTLKDRLAQRGRLSFDETLTIMQQVCAGLDAAHAEGMLHRDIKPGNILFDKRGHAVVGDFGLARAMQLSSIASQSSSAGGVGTPFYKAPELWRGKPPASPATDVYALTCMVYEMLTGRVLFGGDTPDEVLTKHLIDGPDFGTGWPPADAPQGLAEVIQRGLARNPAERYATTKAFVAALSGLTRAVKAGSGSAAIPGGVGGRGAVAARDGGAPGPTLPWGIILGVVGVLGALIIIALLSSRSTPGVQVPVTVEVTRMVTVSAAPRATPIAQVSDKDGMTLLYVPAGEFTMGSNDGDSDEKPPHTVDLDAFWIDQTEVTNAQFKKFVADLGYKTDAEKQGFGYAYDPVDKSWSDTKGADWQHPRGPSSNLSGLDDHPVLQVSWNDATAYCQWAGRSLPTEAQWEKAARGTDGRIYPWGNETPDANRLNFNENVRDTTEVGQYPAGASPYGAWDMAGNVWEWVADWYGSYPSSPQRNPTGPSSGEYRVLRGGSWVSVASSVRASYRNWVTPDVRVDLRVVNVGFRCVR